MVDVVVLNYNDADTTVSFVKSVINYMCISHIVIVDNCSTNDAYSILHESFIKSDKVAVIRTGKNGGYGYGNNYGIQYAIDTYASKSILICNPDVIVSEETISTLYQFLRQNPSYAIVAPHMYDGNGREMPNSAFMIPSAKDYVCSLSMLFRKCIIPFLSYHTIDKNCQCVDVDGVSGALLMINAQDIVKCGMYDENIFLYCEEMVLAIRMKNAGFKTALLPKERYIHNHSVTVLKVYGNEATKQKHLVHSQLYVIEKYFNVKGLELIFARLLSYVSVSEVWMVSVFREW